MPLTRLAMPTRQRGTISSISSLATTSTDRTFLMSTSRQSFGTDSPTWGDVRRRWANFDRDLRAFLSLLIARFIVWRALRRKRKAAAAHSEDLMVACDD